MDGLAESFEVPGRYEQPIYSIPDDFPVSRRIRGNNGLPASGRFYQNFGYAFTIGWQRDYMRID